MLRYFILTARFDEESCAISFIPRKMPGAFKPAAGVRLGAVYPDGLAFQMDEDRGLRVHDVIYNNMGYLMVSGRLKKLLEQHARAEIEFLRFTLINHKGRVASDDCYIVNVIGTRDWVDMQRSAGQANPLIPDRFMRVFRLVLAEERIDTDANFFRTSAMRCHMIIREDLRALLEAEGITGAEWLEMNTPIDVIT